MDSEDVRKLIELCGNRALKIENSATNFARAKFLRFTDEIKRNATMPCKNEHSAIHRETIRTYFQQHRDGKTFRTQLKEINELIAKQLPNWTILFLIGAVIGGAFLVIAAVMVKPFAGAAAASSAVQYAVTAAPDY